MPTRKPLASVCALLLALGVLLAGCGGKAAVLLPKSGSLPGNSNNGGYVLADGAYIYYTDFANGRRLCRSHWDGTGEEVISGASCIALNADEDWIYYKNREQNNSLWRVRKDGSDTQQLTQDAVIYPQLLGGWLYYLQMDDDRKLFRIQTDGAGAEQISGDHCAYPNATPGGIYYVNVGDENRLYHVALDGAGGGERALDARCGQLNILDGWAYYISRGYQPGVFRWQTGTANMPERLADAEDNSILVAADNTLYFTRSTGIFSIPASGGAETCLAEENNIQNLFVAGERVYWLGSGGGALASSNIN
ncbi:MAG: DUF5050 domain-containing protein [Oscillospiraceae bacterium]|nr:DUF5050 domain-containing protein [Oscillospiraceae bacterium]